MLIELQALVEHCTRNRPSFSALRERFGDRWHPATPADALDFVMAYCRAALPLLREPGDDIGAQGADALLHFIAALPRDVETAIRAVGAFQPPAPRAWNEPHLDAYVSLCCTVTDVWCHLLGPEADVDAAILRTLLRQKPRRALDYGAGAGHYALALAAHGVEVDVVEVDPIKRRFLAWRAGLAGLGARIRFDREHGVCDLALALNVLDHLEDPAAAVAELAQALAPGGALCIFALFPRDGWHQSDTDAIDRCAAALWQAFEPAAATGLAGFEVFRRRADDASADGGTARVPCLHPRSTQQVDAADGHVVFAASTFYSRACCVDAGTAEVCAAFDGRRTLGAIAADFGVAEDELQALCDYLLAARQLYWVDTATARPLPGTATC